MNMPAANRAQRIVAPLGHYAAAIRPQRLEPATCEPPPGPVRYAGVGRSERSDDEDLVRGFRAGASWALTAVWNTHNRAVLGYLRGRGVADAEDLTSEVFLQVFRATDRFRGDASDLRTFIFSVAHARYVDQVRMTVRRGAHVEFDPAEHGAVADSAEGEALADPSGARVRQLLTVLSLDQREVLLLRIVADLSLEQTAKVLGKSLGAVKALQHRGLAALRPHVEQAVSK
jgi:RNA polymerase sigma factor (sigma-70 family)